MPEPILVSIATALATKGAQSLYDLVRKKFANRKEATKALEAAQGASAGSTEVAVLASYLDQATTEDPVFSSELRHEWQLLSVQQADHGSVNNQINVSGNVDKVIQATTIHGGITFR